MNALCAILLTLLGAADYNAVVAEGDELYGSGDYTAAADRYERVIAEGVVDPVLFYNLGNAYYRQGLLGPAIANYERALHLDPGFENARNNLSVAVEQTDRALERPLPPAWEQSLLFWHYRLAAGTTRTLALALWVVLWGVLASRLWKPWRYSRVLALLLFVLALAFGASAWSKAHPPMLAVANETPVPVHYGTDETEAVRYELFEGDRVTVDAMKPDWIRVCTADGERGWARASAFTLVGPPYERPTLGGEETLSP